MKRGCPVTPARCLAIFVCAVVSAHSHASHAAGAREPALTVSTPDAQAMHPDPGAFSPASTLDLEALTSLVLRTSPAMQPERLLVDVAEAEVTQSRLLANPALDAASDQSHRCQ